MKIEDEISEIFGKEIDTTDDIKPDIENVCPVCSKVCNSKRGLAIHQASHNRGSKSRTAAPIEQLERRAAEAYLTIFDTVGSTLYLGGMALKNTRKTELVGAYLTGGGKTLQRDNEQVIANSKMVGAAIAAKGEESVAKIEAFADSIRVLIMVTSHINLLLAFHENGQTSVVETRKRRETIEKRAAEIERATLESS